MKAPHDGLEIFTLASARAEFERRYISETLESCNGNMSRAAGFLGLERSNLYKKMKALGLKKKDKT